MNLKTRLAIFFSVIALFGVIVLYVLEFQWFQNSFEVQRLVTGAVTVGLFVGVLFGLVFQKKGNALVEKMQIGTACLIVPVLLIPLLASLTNGLFATQAVPTEVQFWEEKAYTLNRYGMLKGDKVDTVGYFIFVIKDGEMMRLENETPVFPTAKQGDTVKISTRKGLWDIEFVEMGN